MRLHTKIILVVAGLQLLAGTLVALLSSHAIGVILTQELEQRGLSRAPRLADEAQAAMAARQERQLLPILQSLAAETKAAYVLAQDPSGLVLAHTNVVEKGRRLQDPPTRRALALAAPGSQKLSVRGRQVLDIAVPIMAQGDDYSLTREPGRKRLGVIRIGVPLSDVARTKTIILFQIAFIISIAGGLMAAVAGLFVRRILLPVRLLTASAARISCGQYGATVRVDSRDEISQLARSFNAMSLDLDRMLRSMLDILVVTDTQGRIRTINTEGRELLGYDELELRGQPAARLWGAAGCPAQLERLLEGGPVKDLEVELCSKSGQRLPVLLSSSALDDATGAAAGVIMVGKDLSERKRSERALQRSEELLREDHERLKLALHAARMGVWHWDVVTDQLDFDAQVCRLLGIDRATFTGRAEDFLRAVHPDDREAVLAALARTCSQDAPYEAEYRAVWPDGRVHHLLARGKLIRDHAGRPAKVNGIVWDATETKTRESCQALSLAVLKSLGETKASENTIRSILLAVRESTGIEAVGLRLKEGADYPYFVTEGFPPEFVEKDSGLCARLPDGTLLRDRSGGVVLECLCGHIINGTTDPQHPSFTSGGSFWTNDAAGFRTRTASEKRLGWARLHCEEAGYESIALIPLRSKEHIIGLLLFCDRRKGSFDQDMIEFFESLGVSIGIALDRKRAEDEREQLFQREQVARAEAEAANHAKDDFLAIVSHELRTPLTSILGWAWLLRTGGLSDSEREHGLDVITRNMEAQHRIVEDLLDISSLTRGRLTIESQPLELGPLLEYACESVLREAERRSMRIVREIAPDVAVVGDAGRLHQVVANLLNNAIKFSPDGGEIRVTLRAEGGRALVSVADAGQGISPEFMPYVFDIFRQGEDPLTRKHEGLGLGLAIVKHIVELHHGEVSARSAGEGRGAVFTVDLPTIAWSRAAGPVAGSDDPTWTSGLTGLRILVVDDEAGMRELLKVLLERCGAAVQTAGSSRAAESCLEQEVPDVLLCDLAMPQEDGCTFIRRLRERGGRLGALPAAAFTAMARQEDRVRALRAGFQVFLTKPIDPMELLCAVRVLAGRTPRQAAPRPKNPSPGPEA